MSSIHKLEEEYERINETAGVSGKYQYILCAVLFLVGTVNSFLITSLPYLEELPLVQIYKYSFWTNETFRITPEICANRKDFDVRFVNEPKNWVMEYELYCDQEKIELFATFIGFGSVVGCILSHILGTKYGLKDYLVFFLYSSLTILVLFVCNVLKWLWFVNFLVFLFSVSSVCIIIYKITLMSEQCCSSSRPYYIATILSSNFISILLNIFFFEHIRNWVYIFILYACICFFSIIIMRYTIYESARYFLITGNFNELKQSLTNIAKTNENKLNDLGNHFSDLYLTMKNTDSYASEEQVGLTGNVSIEDVIRRSDKKNDSNTPFSDTIRFWREIMPNKVLFQNFILLIVFQLFLPSIYSGTTRNLKAYYKDYPHLWYRVGLVELIVRFMAAYLMNIPKIGRKISKIIFLSFIALGCIISKIADPNKTNLIMDLVIITRVSAEIVNFINNVHMIEIFPTVYRLKAISFLALVARFGSFIFPVVFDKFNSSFSNLLIFYSIIGVVVTLTTNETVSAKLSNYPSSNDVGLKQGSS